MKMLLFELITVPTTTTSSRSAILVRFDCDQLRKRYYSINHSAFKHGQEVRLTKIYSSSNLMRQVFYTQIVLITKIVRNRYNPHRIIVSKSS